MNIYDPARPKTSSNLPALLNGGPYIVPIVNVFPLPGDTVELRVFVPIGNTSGFTFTSRNAQIPIDDLSQFFTAYCRDPELTLLLYFKWEMTPITKPKPTPRSTPLHNPQLDLI